MIRLVVGVIVICIGGVLVGCGGNASPTPHPAAQTATPEPTVRPVAATATPAPSPSPTATPAPADPASSPNGAGPAVFVWRTNGTGAQQLAQPNKIAVDAQDNLYVMDSSHYRIVKYGSNGRFLTTWGSQGSNDGQFVLRRGAGHPGAIAVDPQGAVLVLDDTGRLQRFDANGTFLGKRTYGIGTGDAQFDFPQGMALDREGNLYVTDAMNNRVQKFDPGGTFVTTWGRKGSGQGEFDFPDHVALNPAGNVYITDGFNNRVQKFDGNGTFLGMWGTTGTGEGQFERILGIAIDQRGNVYVSDNQPGRIEKFDPNGRFLGQWGSTGSGNGQFAFAGGLAVDSQGNIYAVGLSGTPGGDSDDCIQKFRPR